MTGLRHPVAEGDVHARSWQPEDFCDKQFVAEVLDLLDTGPASRHEIAMAMVSDDMGGYAYGTIQGRVSAALLWLRRDGLAQPTGSKIGRSTVWARIEMS